MLRLNKEEAMEEKISVIIPVYKVEKYIRRCVDSVLNQSYENIEVILVDDGSPDTCGTICDEYARKDKRVVVIHKKNEGLSMARNDGYIASSGDYLAFVDSDDFIEHDMLACMMERILKDGSDLVICNYLYVDEEGKSICGRNDDMPIIDEVLTKNEILCKLGQNYRWYYVPAWNRLYSRRLLNQEFFPRGKTHEDEFVVHHLFDKCDKVSCVRRPLYMYVQRDDSIMSEKFSVRRLDGMEAFCDRVLFAREREYAEMENMAFRSARRLLLRAYIKLEKSDWKDIPRCREIRKLFCRTYRKIIFDNISIQEKCKGLGMILMPRLLARWSKEV